MLSKKVTVTNETGIHARPASLFVQEFNKYEAEIKLDKDGSEVNAKSIMGIMSLGVGQGSEITIKADGDDAQDAIDALVELIKNDFGE